MRLMFKNIDEYPVFIENVTQVRQTYLGPIWVWTTTPPSNWKKIDTGLYEAEIDGDRVVVEGKAYSDWAVLP